MKKLVLALALTVPMFASPALFSKYEGVRQGLLANSLPKTQTAAKALADAARSEKNAAVAKLATNVANAASLAKAREAFSPLSQELIKVRNAEKGDRPAVGSCLMLKKQWLQPKGAIGNPYLPDMVTCGEFVKD